MNLNKLTLTKYCTVIEDSDIDKEKLSMAKEMATKKPSDGPAKAGDFVHVDYYSERNGGKRQGAEDVIGEPKSMCSGLHDAIIGMKPGEWKEANVTFGDGHAEEGNTVKFRVLLHHIFRLEVPDLEDWIKEKNGYSVEGDIDSQILTRLTKKAEKYSDINIREQIERFVTGIDDKTAFDDLTKGGKPVDIKLVDLRREELEEKRSRKWREATVKLNLSATYDDVEAYHAILHGVCKPITPEERKKLKIGIERDRVTTYIKESVKTNLIMVSYEEFNRIMEK